MKTIKTFESFINEGRDWSDWDTSEIVKKYIKDVKNDKSKDASDLSGFMSNMSYKNRIEESPEKWYVEDIIDELAKKGFKNIKIEDFIKAWESDGGKLWWD